MDRKSTRSSAVSRSRSEAGGEAAPRQSNSKTILFQDTAYQRKAYQEVSQGYASTFFLLRIRRYISGTGLRS